MEIILYVAIAGLVVFLLSVASICLYDSNKVQFAAKMENLAKQRSARSVNTNPRPSSKSPTVNPKTIPLDDWVKEMQSRVRTDSRKIDESTKTLEELIRALEKRSRR